jgi:hypothetical protein
MRHLRFFTFLLALIALIYRTRRRWYAWLIGLPSPCAKTEVETNLRIPIVDGVTLAADHHFPAQPGQYPTILIRTPYGRNLRSGAFGGAFAFLARRFAERGYHVLIQDVRGRFDSEGEFDPYFNEKQDGLATLKWLTRQPWFNGQVGTWGNSYLGIVQWVVAAHSHAVQALVLSVTSSSFHKLLFPDGAVDLGLVLRWIAVLREQHRVKDAGLLASLPILLNAERQIRLAFEHLPLQDIDQAAFGEKIGFFQKWLTHLQPDDPIWQEVSEDIQLANINAPVHLIGGWYDMFLRGLLHDYLALKAAGKQPYLTVGPWYHLQFNMMITDLREGIRWFDTHLKKQPNRLRQKPVRLYVMGKNEWQDFDSYPPPAQPIYYYLHDGQCLSTDLPADDSPPISFCYDPANPTPAIGGTGFDIFAGPRDNRRLEARSDVLIYTSKPLTHDMTVIGPVRTILYVSSSCDHTDFFARLCDVQPNQQSINICDGLFRIQPGNNALQSPSGGCCIEIDMWATAHCFHAGHALRLQVSSGAHPRWNRNPGTGKPPATAIQMVKAHQTVFHDALRPSALELPVTAID